MQCIPDITLNVGKFDICLTIRVRVVDQLNYHPHQKYQMHYEEPHPLIRIDMPNNVMINLISGKSAKLVEGMGYDDSLGVLSQNYVHGNLKYLGNLSHSETEESSHNYLVMTFNYNTSKNQHATAFLSQFPIVFKLHLPGDLPKKIWKDFKAKIVDWEPPHVSPLPSHALS